MESAAFGFAFQVERFYTGLIRAADATSESEPGLGGKLLYAGELDAEARALLVAANIAGAASLAATSDSAAGKQAIRDGVVDFLVTSLDEALRILKNEIRKHETAAVCVALPSEAVAREMLERGVLPDLLRPGSSATPVSAAFLSQGAMRIEPVDANEGQVFVTWRVAAAPALWLPRLDAIALGSLEENVGAPGLDSETWDPARRWLRLAPRYLGRLAQGVRLLHCDERSAAAFLERVREEVESGKIAITVEFSQSRNGQWEHYSFAPPTG